MLMGVLSLQPSAMIGRPFHPPLQRSTPSWLKHFSVALGPRLAPSAAAATKLMQLQALLADSTNVPSRHGPYSSSRLKIRIDT